MFLLIGLVSIITAVILLQPSTDLRTTLAAVGFALFTIGWTGMYFRLKREVPGHALVNATYLNVGSGWTGHGRAGFRNLVRLVRLHVERHRADLWSVLFAAGGLLLAASFVGYLA